MWYEWNTKEDFDNWHNALCVELGYPLTPVNQATGEPDENAQKTVAYTESHQIENKWIALIEPEYANGLTATDLRLPEQERPQWQ